MPPIKSAMLLFWDMGVMEKLVLPSMLFLTGQTDRLGRIVDGNTVGDSEAEEIKRQISISLATMYSEYRGCKSIFLTRPVSLISQVKLQSRSASQMPELLSAQLRTASPSVLRRRGSIWIVKNSRALSTFQKLMKKTATTKPFTARCVRNTARLSAR